MDRWLQRHTGREGRHQSTNPRPSCVLPPGTRQEGEDDEADVGVGPVAGVAAELTIP